MSTIDIRIPQADPSGNPLPDPAAAAAFWRALPKDIPATAVEVALRCVAVEKPVYPVAIKQNRVTGKTEKHPAVRDYYGVASTPADHVDPDGGPTLRLSTLDPDTCRAWWGPGGRFARCGVGVVLGDAFALDADDDDAAAWLADVVVDAADTWIIHGGRGARAVYRRPAWVADVKPDGWRGSQRGAAVGGCDVVGGVLVVWTPGAKRRSWTGGPEHVADPSPAIDRALRAVLDPPRPALALPADLGPALPVEASRGTAYVWTVLTSLRADVAALAAGTHNVGAHHAAVLAGLALGKASRPDMADDALDVLTTAAPWASKRKHRETIRRGISWGLAHADEGLPDRPLQPRATPTPATGPDADAIRADIAGRLAALPDAIAALADDNGKPVHHRRRRTLGLLAPYALTSMYDAGRAEHCEALDQLGKAIDKGKGAIMGALPYLPRLGFDVDIGGINDDGTGRATRLGISQSSGPRPKDAGGGDGGSTPVAQTDRSVRLGNSLTEARGLVAAAGDDVTRGLRRRSKPEDKTMGDLSPWFVDALRAAAGPIDAETIAAAVGCHPETARKNLRAAVERGPVVTSTAPATGRGRPRLLYALAEVVTPAVEAVCALGAVVKARAELAIKVSRDRLRKARALALRGVGTVRSWLALFSARTRAERRAARGGELGRPEYGRDAGVRALHVAATWVLDGRKQANPTPPAELETPPEWAYEAVPLDLAPMSVVPSW